METIPQFPIFLQEAGGKIALQVRVPYTGFYTKGRPLEIQPLRKVELTTWLSILNINIQSNPVISRAVNSRKSVSRACTLDPSDPPLATPIWHSMVDVSYSRTSRRNDNPLISVLHRNAQYPPVGRAGQLRISPFGSDFDFASDSFENPVCHVTLASTPAEKRQLPRWTAYFLVQMQLQVDTTIGPNQIMYFYCVQLFEMRFANCHREAHPTLVKRGHAGPPALAWNHFCFLSSRDVVWLISTQNPSCVALHNVWFDSFVA